MNLPPSRESLIGTAAHTALEYAVGGKHTVARCIKISVTEHRLTTPEIEAVKAFQPAIENFLSKFSSYRQRHNAGTPVIEQQLAIDFNGKSVGFWANNILIRGVVDLSVPFIGRPHALILDHKSGKEHDLKYYEDQFMTYALLTKAKTPELEAVKLGINFIKTDRVAFRKGMHDVRDIVPLVDRAVTFLNDAAQDVNNIKLVRPGPLCDWCDYYSICPAQADGANGKDTN